MHTAFEGKVALVTGAAGGIGLATAKAFALAGASVVVADHNETLLNEAAEKLRGEGHNVLAVTCDVSDKAQVAAMIDLAVKTYGRLDAAFNNAGINCNATPILHEGRASSDGGSRQRSHCELFVHRRNCWKPRAYGIFSHQTRHHWSDTERRL